MGDYEGALGRLATAGLDQLTEKALPTRSLRIVAESYAIKGVDSSCQVLVEKTCVVVTSIEQHDMLLGEMSARTVHKCLSSEKVPLTNNSKYQRAEKAEKMIKCFELAGDLTLLYLQEQDKLSSTPSTHSLQSLPASNTTGN
ncbi:hypothetical protein OTU49_012355 [Cherax quadricarinatus]|uniref:Tetratricopeptide repeat protein 7 N-terminal domain-containing protein n=1 Tax=Cherax quadricarinatus TaxID=27406 RepID=A0AAW0VY10_CHEQU